MANTPTSSGTTVQRNGGAQPSTAAPDISADADALVNEARSAAGKIAEEAKEQAASLTDRAKDEVDTATRKVKSMAADQKDLLAAQVGGVADAMERAASELESNNGASAQYARMIAENAEKLSSAIRDNSVEELLGMAQDFGRRQPALFMGAAALLGFAASRFVMASATRRDEKSAATDTSSGYQEYPGEPASDRTDSGESWTTGGL